MERSLINNLKENELSNIKGMVQNVRNTKYMIFIILRDRSGHIQVSVDKQNENLTNIAEGITNGSIISCDGKMILSEYVKDGGKEFTPENIEIISKADVYPIDENALPDNKLDYRFLDLRGEKKHLIFDIQTKLTKYLREYLYENDFTEIHTPKLIGTASESGSSVFEVKYFDRKAYLAQSPQFYKQMAIASGYERVFELAPCFRAENSNTNRHCTEFTSFDIEMAYINDYTDVMHFEENLLKYAFNKINEEYADELEKHFIGKINIPKGHFPVVNLDVLMNVLHDRYNYTIPEGDIGDMNAEAEKLATKYAREEFNSDFLFITGFSKAKRPFYHLRKDDMPQGFDLIYNGTEITSGSQREHRYEELLNNANEKGLSKDVEFYMEFFKYGMPPHGGFAFGLDRITMLMLGIDHIRDAEFIFRGPNRLNP